MCETCDLEHSESSIHVSQCMTAPNMQTTQGGGWVFRVLRGFGLGFEGLALGPLLGLRAQGFEVLWFSISSVLALRRAKPAIPAC